MSPEKQQELENRIIELERRLNALSNLSDYDPEVVRAISKVTLRNSSASPATYDKAVNESGASTYNVADVFDGFYETADGKLIGYYNP